MRRVIRGLVGALAAASLALATACGEDASDGAAPNPDNVTAHPDNVTAPGTELSVGETAVINYRDTYLVAFTVTVVNEADQAEFQEQFEDADLIGYEVWYTIENLSDEDMAGVTFSPLLGVYADGSRTENLSSNSLGDCWPLAFPDDAGRGTVHEICNIVAAPVGMELAGVEYSGGDPYYEDPILWWR